MKKRMRVMLHLKILSMMGKNHKKAAVIKKSGLFAGFGDDCYWHPDWIPSNPSMVEIGNNVTIAADVRIYDHDIIQRMWNNDPKYCGKFITPQKGYVRIGDNSVICAKSIILYNINIGKNVVVGAGSVVTKDVPDFAIVAGSPAKVIGDTRELMKKRLELSGVDITNYSYADYFKE